MRRLEESVRELGPTAAALEPAVAAVLGSHPPLGERIRLRALQQAFVLHRVLAKKAWVSRRGAGPQWRWCRLRQGSPGVLQAT